MQHEAWHNSAGRRGSRRPASSPCIPSCTSLGPRAIGAGTTASHFRWRLILHLDRCNRRLSGCFSKTLQTLQSHPKANRICDATKPDKTLDPRLQGPRGGSSNLRSRAPMTRARRSRPRAPAAFGGACRRRLSALEYAKCRRKATVQD